MVELIRRLEALPPGAQASYRRRLGLLAALGYAYVIALLLLVLGALAGLIVLSVRWGSFHAYQAKFGIALVAFAALIVRSLWVRVERPQGIELTRSDAPKLFDEVADLCEKLRAPRFHHILAVADYNAAVMQVPRLGLLGWQDNYLLVGLSLMQATTPEQFRAVLAHEIGHLSGNHGRFSVWIWRVEATWGRLTEELAQRQHRGAFLVNWFANWYGPYFHAYSFVLMRKNEREADEYMEELAGREASAQELAAGAVWAQFLEEDFWRGVFGRVNEEPEPPHGAFPEMMDELRRTLPSERQEEWLLGALAVKTGYDDTHPSLADRLAALGYDNLAGNEAARRALLAGEIRTTAAEHFFGEHVGEYAARFDADWRERVGPAWAQRHAAVRQGKARLAELAQRGAEAGLSEEEAWEQAHLTTEFGEDAEAISLLRGIVESRPDFVPARFVLGQLLLAEEDEAGVGLLEEAMERDGELVPPACEALYAFCRRTGRQAEAEAYLSRGLGTYNALAEMEREKATFTKGDVYLPPDLPEEQVEWLRELLRGLPEVTEAYLVRKRVGEEIEKEFHVLGVVPRFKGLLVNPNKAVANLLDKIEFPEDMPFELMAVVLYDCQAFARTYAFLRKKMREVEGSLIYQKEQ
jgi:Zn-dependent protease with chaperone function